MKKNPAAKNYVAYVHVTYDLTVPVTGTTFEEALQSAVKLQAQEVVDIESLDVNDYSIRLDNVHVA